MILPRFLAAVNNIEANASWCELISQAEEQNQMEAWKKHNVSQRQLSDCVSTTHLLKQFFFS